VILFSTYSFSGSTKKSILKIKRFFTITYISI
jgi:hypothetical protein